MAPAHMANSDDLIGPGGGDDGATARLLLALTSLYVQRPVHSAEEQRQYVELALRLIDRAGPDTRADVAARLRRHPDAPVEVIARLGGFPCGGDGVDETPSHVAANHVAADGHAAGEPLPAGDPVPQHDGRLAGGEREPALPPSKAAPEPEPLTPEFGEAFFAASPPERRQLLSLLAMRGGAEAGPEGSRRFHARIDPAAWRGRSDAFVRDFERLIDAPRSLCERILNDPWGEPMVVAARATGMPVAMLQRILLVVSRTTNHPVRRVYELTELYHSLDGSTARDLLAAWRQRSADRPPQTALTVVTNPRCTNLLTRFAALNARLEKQAGKSRDGSPD